MVKRAASLPRAVAVFVLLGSAAPLLAQNGDADDVKRVVRAETEAVYARNADAWQGTWLHDAKASRTFVSPGVFRARVGWENFGPETVKGIGARPAPIQARFEQTNYNIQVDGNMAWMEFDQNSTVPNSVSALPSVSREHRVLLKREGQWKILTSTTAMASGFGSTPDAIENQLNSTGYNLLREKKANDAIEVFKLNVRLFPNSWNVYDSLGEADAAAGETKLAIENYEKSIAVNPQNNSGKEALVKLRAGKAP